MAIELVVQTNIEVAMLEEEVEERYVTRLMCKAIIVESLVILQESTMLIRKNLKKVKLELQEESVMMKMNFW